MKAAVFDLDGTLIDTLGDIRDAINYALRAFDCSPVSDDETRRFVGSGLRKARRMACAAKKADIRDDDELEAHTLSQFEPHLLLVSVDVSHNLLCLITGKYTEVHPAYTQIRTDTAVTDTHQHAPHRACLHLKHLAQLLLYQASNLILSCCFQFYLLFLLLVFFTFVLNPSLAPPRPFWGRGPV